MFASTFDTTCSAAATPVSGCERFGTYSVHNVIVESTDDGRVLAYLSWYWDGMLIVDVTNPSKPVEVTRDGSVEPSLLDVVRTTVQMGCRR